MDDLSNSVFRFPDSFRLSLSNPSIALTRLLRYYLNSRTTCPTQFPFTTSSSSTRLSCLEPFRWSLPSKFSYGRLVHTKLNSSAPWLNIRHHCPWQFLVLLRLFQSMLGFPEPLDSILTQVSLLSLSFRIHFVNLSRFFTSVSGSIDFNKPLGCFQHLEKFIG